MDYLLKTNLFKRKNTDTLIDKYGITYKFDCKDNLCNIIVDVNDDKKPNMLSVIGLISDQTSMVIEKREKGNQRNILKIIDSYYYIYILIE